MPENRSLFVAACQQVFALTVVGAVAASAVGVIELEIVPPVGEASVGVEAPRSVVDVAPVKPKVRTVPLGDGASAQSPTVPRSSQENKLVSGQEPVTGFATVGVTWDEDAQLADDEITVSVRTKTDGRWTPWQGMDYDADHGPDPGSEESRAGTDAVVVGDVDDVQVKAETDGREIPQDLSLAIVDPRDDVVTAEQPPAIDTAQLTSASGDALQLTAGGVSAPKPQIFSRAQWGADERLRDPGSLRYGDIHAGFVHHTVNANDYSREQVPSILRGIYAYHTRSRGWSDVGYNFLVDRFGRIWEGRYGGVARPVVGAHTLGYNEDSFAMSAIGNFETTRPSEAMLNAYGALMAWKLSLHGIRAGDTRQLVAGRYFQAINGHRDAGSTACPGRYLYERLPAIRRRATAIQDGGVEPTPTPTPTPTPEPPPEPIKGTPLNADLSGAEWPDLVVRDRRTQHAVIIRTGGQTSFLRGVSGEQSWAGMDLVAAAGDVDEDGIADLVARSRNTGRATAYLGEADGSYTTARTYDRFAGLDQLTGVGDFDGDGDDDLVGRRAADQALLLFPGDGTGRFGAPRVLRTDWGAYDRTAGVDDVDGDGHVDLVARSGDTLYLFLGTGRALAKKVALAGAWSRFDLLAGRGDATGDGHPDLVARVRETGTTYLYPGDGAGGWGPRFGGWAKFAGLRWIAIAGQLTGTKSPDLAGVHRDTGRVVLYPHNGRSNLGRRFDTGTTLTDTDLLLNVGDWNGDGRGDVMTRQASTGRLLFRAGLVRNRLAAPVVAATGWDRVSAPAAVGDVTGDGHPDLVGRAADGRHRVYPGNGKTGFGTSVVAHGPFAGRTQLTLGLWDDDREPDQAMRRRDGTLWVWSSETSKGVQVADGLRRYDWVRGLGDLDGDGRSDVVARARRSGHLYLLLGGSDGLAPRRLLGTGFDGYDLG